MTTVTKKGLKMCIRDRIWNVIVNIHGAVQAIGLALLVLFFVVGIVKTCGSFAEVQMCIRDRQYEGLKELRLIHFDDWAANSGETVIAMELNTTGTGLQMRTRFARF